MDETSKPLLVEDFCTNCDCTVHAVFDNDGFRRHQTGVVRCPECGAAIMPCNECNDHDSCDKCPWRNVQAETAMSDEAYLRFLRAYEPAVYLKFKCGDHGDWSDLVDKIENG